VTIHLSNDFKDFLKLLNSRKVRYLLVGGHAVGIHGYPRFTSDMDIWVDSDADNASRLAIVVREFGFDLPEVEPELFQKTHKVIRMGFPPDRIKLLTTLSGVVFDDCYRQRHTVEIDGIPLDVIGMSQLITNKKAAGRHKDWDDLEHLE